ncbi:tyrosine--tRNA ligase [Blattabacterium cuenoti]|uniref:tyrosine--tRNA ligase n=1 Tax=Blattabacterium cuenoti TaxID=1653831 RepID=UPI001EEC853D|nr:tyrosine--tRNA ligase [Blattabacterium cuenoti]
MEELLWRGLIQNQVPGLKNKLNQSTTIYSGLDPTSDSLHLGNLLPIIVLIHLQKKGHKSIILIGGATGYIGDPSGKKNKRILLDKEVLNKNAISIEKQIHHLLNFFSEKIEIVNNKNWMKNTNFVEFIHYVGIHFSINYMLSKESVKNRIENKKNGISFMEFSYSLIQGFDFFYLNKTRKCEIQIGGSDQWGNIITGIDLIKKKTGKKTYGFTFPLITKSNGIKFGKSEKGENIWINSNKTSPYKFYQFWINISDNEIEKYIKIYSFLNPKTIENLIQNHRKEPSKRILQKNLAYEMTRWIHGETKSKKIIEITSILFEKNHRIIHILNEKIFDTIYENIPHACLSKKEFNKGYFLTDFLKKIGFFSSKKKADFAIKNQSISINKKNVKKNFLIKKENIIGNKYILFQFGKKNFFIVKIF